MFEFLKPFQFEVEKLSVLMKSKCLTAEAPENYEKLNFI